MNLKILFPLLFIFITTNILAQNTPCPCCTPQHRQFDFWVGEWEAFANDKLAGTNSIVLLEDKCVIQENWKSAAGDYTGTSYNFYDQKAKKWKQLWLDNQGDSLELSGNFADGKMILQSKEQYSEKNKANYIDRITWTDNEDGTVRQHWERTTDGGKTWSNVFDGLYKRK
jgi:hypothetical protein